VGFIFISVVDCKASIKLLTIRRCGLIFFCIISQRFIILQKAILGINCVDFKDSKAKQRQGVAVDVLLANKTDNFEVIDFCYPNEKPVTSFKNIFLRRNSKDEMGNQRPLPYIKEIMDSLAHLNSKEDYVFGYMNSDILLTKNFFNIFNTDKIMDAYIFSRKEITDVSNAKMFNDGRYNFVWGGDKHAGADAFFFKKSWWLKNSNCFSDNLILGETEWDTVYRHIIKHLTNKYLNLRELLHVYHDAKWDINSIGGKNNIKIWEGVKCDFA